jgi:hypothetical protein
MTTHAVKFRAEIRPAVEAAAPLACKVSAGTELQQAERRTPSLFSAVSQLLLSVRTLEHNKRARRRAITPFPAHRLYSVFHV